jgi:hypothetical protein
MAFIFRAFGGCVGFIRAFDAGIGELCAKPIK